MNVRLEDKKGAIFVSGTLVYPNMEVKIKDIEKSEEILKREIFERNRKIMIKDNGEWINGEKYFRATVEADITVGEEIDYEDIFDRHWKKQVQKIQEYEDLDTLEKILGYAKENGISDGVITRIEDYIEGIR